MKIKEHHFKAIEDKLNNAESPLKVLNKFIKRYGKKSYVIGSRTRLTKKETRAMIKRFIS